MAYFDFDKMRIEMVEKQLKSRDITDTNVLNAIEKVPRHLFIPYDLAEQSYDDHPLPISYGQTISQPYIVAYMTQILDIDKDDRILEIGTGSGYQTAILAELAGEVFTIEYIPELSYKAQDVLNELSYENINFKIGNGYYGWDERQPYDKIIVTASPEIIPPSLIQQLKISGKMVLPIGKYDQILYLIIKKNKDEIERIPQFAVAFVPFVDG